MKKLNYIEVTPQEEQLLQRAGRVAEAIWLRFLEANGGRWEGELDMQMEVKAEIGGKPNAWWSIHPSGEYLQTGHSKSLTKAFKEMLEHGTKELKQRQAKQYREAAARLEKEAQEVEAETTANV